MLDAITSSTSGSVVLGAVLGLIIGGAILLAYGMNRKTHKNYFRKAKKMHKKAEKYHILGDEELAQDYFREAEQYREKAEGLRRK